ncbi:MAG: hypothetical protein EOM91_01400 [Sphingobacteriia bacterium]|nr:hypothetical protein [Sphingobacteriia bacterium]NCC39368.1 hypothetical protein [Gammaproteobacteria bacterium]
MGASKTSFWRQIAGLLLATLVGVYLLYAWYTDTLDARLSDAAARIEDGEGRIGSLQAEIDRLQSEITARAAEHASEQRRIEEQLAAAARTNTDLEQALEQLRRSDAELIAAEQEKTAAVTQERDRSIAETAELQARLTETEAALATQEETLDSLKQAIADSALEHREQIEQLERHLNERVTLAKATPKDADLMRAAQAAGLLPEVTALDQETTQLATTLEQVQGELAKLQAEQAAERTAHQQQLAALEEALAAAREALDHNSGDATAQLEAVKAEHAQALAAAEARISTLSEQLSASPSSAAMAELQERLEHAESQLAASRHEADSTIEALRTAQAEQLSAAEARISALSEQLAAGPSNTAMAELKERLEHAESQLAKTQHEADSAIEALRAAQAEQLSAAEARIAELTKQIEDLPGESEISAARQQQTADAALETALAEVRQQAAATQATLREAAEQSRRELQGRYAKLAELGGTPSERGILLRQVTGELRFAPGTAELSDSDLPGLERIVVLLADHADVRIRIEGHTDSIGDAEANLALSQQRAEAVRNALIERGVDAGRVSAEGIGQDRPIADNATAAGRALNRRVEIYVNEGSPE